MRIANGEVVTHTTSATTLLQYDRQAQPGAALWTPARPFPLSVALRNNGRRMLLLHLHSDPRGEHSDEQLFGFDNYRKRHGKPVLSSVVSPPFRFHAHSPDFLWSSFLSILCELILSPARCSGRSRSVQEIARSWISLHLLPSPVCRWSHVAAHSAAGRRL